MSRNHRRLDKRLWARTRFLAFNRANFRCEKCGKAGKLEGHHKVALALDDGGSPYDPANVETLCRDCHIEISLSPQRREWVTHIQRAYRSLNETF